jgi:hypothetical protein
MENVNPSNVNPHFQRPEEFGLDREQLYKMLGIEKDA